MQRFRSGVIDVDDWTARRRAGSAHLTGRFCVVTAFETIAALRPRFAGIATGGQGSFEVGYRIGQPLGGGFVGGAR